MIFCGGVAAAGDVRARLGIGGTVDMLRDWIWAGTGWDDGLV